MSDMEWRPSKVDVALAIEVREEVFRHESEEHRCWLARHPVTGIMSQGRTREEAIRALGSAVIGTFHFMREHGQCYEDWLYRTEALRQFVLTRFQRGSVLVGALPKPTTFHERWRRLNDIRFPGTGDDYRMYECLCACPIEDAGITHGPDCLMNPANWVLT